MRIAVIGAGIVGVTTAWELAFDGHEVTVLERRTAVAEETSFANAGVVAPGYVTPWAAPGMPSKVLRYLLSSHAPVRLALPLARQDLGWMWHWLRACRVEAYLANRDRMRRLAFYSRQRLHEVVGQLGLEYERSDGYMVLLRSEQDRRMVAPGLQLLRDAGVAFSELDAAAARLVEPALNPDTDFAGAIHLPTDEVGNCRQFALLLRNEAQRLDARFEFGTTVQWGQGWSGATAGARRSLLCTQRPAPDTLADSAATQEKTTEREFDAVVLCAGLNSAAMLRELGVRVPMAAVHGYSISAQVREPLNAPRSALMDERYKVAVSRLGQRVRVAGSAELGGHLAQTRPAAIQTLYKVLHDWFPGAAQMRHVQQWKGARPMTPDGPPVIGPSGLPGLWLNLGHGSSGWALSCGSARAVADLIGGRKPQVDLQGMGVERFGERVAS